MKIIDRPDYTDKIKKLLGKCFIIALTGQRRVGKSKRLFELNDKFYFEDIGIRNSLVSSGRTSSIEKLIENAIYLHLIRLGYEVTVGQLQKTEIDFIAQKKDQTIYIQATYLLATEETVEREFGNLMLIRDNHPKMVISMDDFFDGTNFQGIRHYHLRHFLLATDLF